MASDQVNPYVRMSRSEIRRETSRLLKGYKKKNIRASVVLEVEGGGQAKINRSRRIPGRTWLVYFIQTLGHPMVKIGKTNTPPEQRLAALQSANPLELVILGVIAGDDTLESELHQRFASLRIRCEWFRLEQEIVEFINTNTFPWDLHRSVIPGWWFSRFDLRSLELIQRDFQLIQEGRSNEIATIFTQF